MQEIDLHAISIDHISSGLFEKKQVDVSVLRLDKVHPFISGNKWFKLKYYLLDAIYKQKTNILTFGGAYSNHIIATAAACKAYKLSCTGIIRGEEPSNLSPVLTEVKKLGMQLHFISRASYSLKQIPGNLNPDDYYIIPEGGYGVNGAKGAAEILSHFPAAYFSHTCCAVGTGTTMAGLLAGSPKTQTVIGISVLKNFPDPAPAVGSLIPGNEIRIHINHDYHFGGYAKFNNELIQFMNRWYRETGIPSDFVYTGKLFFAIEDLVRKDFFPEGSRIMIIHSGGLQGNISLGKGTLIF